jgi:hypothetical protein
MLHDLWMHFCNNAEPIKITIIPFLPLKFYFPVYEVKTDKRAVLCFFLHFETVQVGGTVIC